MKPNQLLAVAFLGVALVCTDCAKEIIATSNRSTTASYDSSAPAKYQGRPTSGVLEIARDDKGNVTGRLISIHLRDRYNSLIGDYGDLFNPNLKKDDGVKPSTTDAGNQIYFIDLQHYSQLMQMAQWKRNGRPPTGTIKKLLRKIST